MKDRLLLLVMLSSVAPTHLEVMTAGQSKKVEEKIFGEESIKIIELG